MKPFRERNPVIIGAISLAVIAVLILLADEFGAMGVSLRQAHRRGLSAVVGIGLRHRPASARGHAAVPNVRASAPSPLRIAGMAGISGPFRSVFTPASGR